MCVCVVSTILVYFLKAELRGLSIICGCDHYVDEVGLYVSYHVANKLPTD